MIRNLLFILLIFLIGAACTHKIVRKDYQASSLADINFCEPLITKSLRSSDSLKQVGQIELKDGGFSSACSEEHALSILRKEACSINAQVVHITEERRPDMTSTCYRCKAIFYEDQRISKSSPLSASIDESTIKERVKNDKRNVAGQVIAYTAGFLVGFLVVSLIIQ